MILRKVSVTNYKNLQSVSLELGEGVNYVFGDNGSGKTNFIDAIHSLCLTKSFVTTQEKEILGNHESFYSVFGVFEKQSTQTKILLVNDFQGGKKIKKENKAYSNFGEYIGFSPLICGAPQHHNIISGHSDERRKFIDKALSQIDNHYLLKLSEYLKVLQQRNKLLKTSLKTGFLDGITLEALDKKLIACGEYVFKKRNTFFKELQEEFKSVLKRLWGAEISIQMEYSSSLSSVSFEKGLSLARNSDISVGRSTFGVHLDDIVFTLEQKPLKRTASQGQQKITLLALLLSTYALFEKTTEQKPILILDDLFDKIDQTRGENILSILTSLKNQIFITSTSNCENTSQKKYFEKTFHVKNGVVIEK